MKLTLTLLNTPATLSPQPVTVDFQPPLITIGRGQQNTMYLPDTERYISTRHSEIYREGNQFFVRDVSTNGTVINGSSQPLGKGNVAALQDGDRITIGSFQLSVAIEEQIMAAPRAREMAAPIISNEPALDFLEPFAAPAASPPNAAPAGFIPDGFNFLDSFLEDKGAPNSKADSVLSSSPLNQAFDVPQPAARIPPQPEPSAPAPDEVQGPTLRGQRTDKSYGLPKVDTSPYNRKVGTPTHSAIGAFFAGAGLSHPALSDEQQIAVLRNAGKLLREMTQGYHEILAARASMKNEFRLDVTTVGAVENNPLKFCVDTDEALEKLLLSRSPAYLAPNAAVRDAVVDIQSHQLALLAGLRVALAALLKYFDPDELEASFRNRKFLDNIVPGSKKGKCWDLFRETYQRIADEAEDDFLRLLGEEFSRAYERQTRHVKANKRSPDDREQSG